MGDTRSLRRLLLVEPGWRIYKLYSVNYNVCSPISMYSKIMELNSYIALRKKYQSTLGNKRIELSGVGNNQVNNVQMASEISNQQLIDSGMKQMDQIEAIEH